MAVQGYTTEKRLTMKKIVFFILVFISVILLSIPCQAKKHSTRTHVRYSDGIVYCYDANTRLAYIETSDGNVWTIKADCTQLGCVRVKFDTMKTRKITDDRIIKINFIK